MGWSKSRGGCVVFYALQKCELGVTHQSQAWRGSCQRRWRWLKPPTAASGRRAWWRSAPWSEDEAPVARLLPADTAEEKRKQKEFNLRVTDCSEVICAFLFLFTALEIQERGRETVKTEGHSQYYPNLIYSLELQTQQHNQTLVMGKEKLVILFLYFCKKRTCWKIKPGKSRSNNEPFCI